MREQVAYPIWEESLLAELDDAQMARLFKEAALSDVRPIPGSRTATVHDPVNFWWFNAK